MNKNIIDRVLQETEYIINTNKTIRELAKIFNISKSTVHKDLNERLEMLDKNKHLKIKKIFDNHISIRHIRGGESTRLKYLNAYRKE